LYVDDIQIYGNNETWILDFKQKLKEKREMDDMGEMKWILGMEVTFKRDPSKKGNPGTLQTVSLSQEKAISDLVRKFKEPLTEASRHYDQGNFGHTADTPMANGTQLSKADSPKTGTKEAAAMKSIPYRSLVGGLLWITNSRPDIAYAVGTC
jgi:hypothetical protein